MKIFRYILVVILAIVATAYICLHKENQDLKEVITSYQHIASNAYQVGYHEGAVTGATIMGGNHTNAIQQLNTKCAQDSAIYFNAIYK